LITKVSLQYFCLSLRFFLSFSLSLPLSFFSLARSFIDDAVCAHNPKDDDVKQHFFSDFIVRGGGRRGTSDCIKLVKLAESFG
jgi:hypothetical protein